MYKVEMTLDDYPINPREEFDHFGVMLCWHSRYSLGDKHHYSDAEHFVESVMGIDDDTGVTEDNFLDWCEENDVLVLPLYLYDHSGLSLSTRPFSTLWDTSRVGWIYADADRIHKVYGDINNETWALAESLLQAEVKEYSAYISGSVYAYIVYDSDGRIVDSCGGFYDLDYMIETIKSELSAQGITEYEVLEDI